MKNTQLIALLLVLTFSACNQAETEKLKQNNNELLEKYKAQEKLNRQMDSVMNLINNALDSVNLSQNGLNRMIEREKGGTRRSAVLKKISDIQRYVNAGNERIEMLEKMLEEQQNKNQGQVSGLMGMIAQLKNELKAKEIEIQELKVQVSSLKDSLLNLKGRIELQQVTLAEREDVINKQSSTISNKEKQLEEEEMRTLNTQIDKLAVQGQGQEDLAAKTHLAVKKKNEYLVNAYNFYKQGRNLCMANPELSNKQRELEIKMNNVKAKMPKKEQLELE